MTFLTCSQLARVSFNKTMRSSFVLIYLAVARGQKDSNKPNDQNQLLESPDSRDLALDPSDMLYPTKSDDQNQALEYSDSQTVALDPGDLPFVPFSGFKLPGSGEMNYGPNIIEQIQQLWNRPFDVHNQPEPVCKSRKIPWGGPFKMYALCCQSIPKNGGSRKKYRMEGRRNQCSLCMIW